MDYIETKGVLFQALMNLYKAMGGGWVVEADRLTAVKTDSKISAHGPALQETEGRILEIPWKRSFERRKNT
jgi:multidrug efflux system outer membrane protein